MSGTGKRMNWSSLYVGNRPRDILKLTETLEANFSEIHGFSGRQQDGTGEDVFELTWSGSVAPTLPDDFVKLPIGTRVYTPKVADVFCYQRQALSDPEVKGDWASVAKTTVT